MGLGRSLEGYESRKRKHDLPTTTPPVRRDECGTHEREEMVASTCCSLLVDERSRQVQPRERKHDLPEVKQGTGLFSYTSVLDDI